MELRLEAKKAVVQELNQKFTAVQTAFLLDYRGLDVAAMTNLRIELAKFNGSVHVIKNTLARLASQGTPVAGIADDFKGPIAITYADDNPVEVAKLLLKFANEHPVVAIRSALLQGKKISAKEIEDLAKLPSKEILYAQLLGVMLAPIQQLYTVFQENSRMMLRVIQARVDKADN